MGSRAAELIAWAEREAIVYPTPETPVVPLAVLREKLRAADLGERLDDELAGDLQDAHHRIGVLEESLKNALTWEGRLNEAEQESMQGNRADAVRIKTKVHAEMKAARAALRASDA